MKAPFSCVALLCAACSAPIPEPGAIANGGFVFRASSGSASFPLDGRSIDSRGGTIAIGTSRDLRIIKGDKLNGYSEPKTIELTVNAPAEVNGVALSDDGARVFVGYAEGVAKIELANESMLVAVLDAPVARLYRVGTTLFAVSFDNVLTTLTLDAYAQPRAVGTLRLEGGAGTIRSATFSGGHATFSAEGVVWVVDVNDPTTPTLIAKHELDGFVGWSARGPAHLFTGNTGPMSVFAMPDDQTLSPAGPASDVELWRVPGNAPVLAGSRLYVFDDQRGWLYVVDVSAPTRPAVLTYLRPKGADLSCEHPRDAVLDADSVLWVACVGGASNYVIDF